jgi:hypothetical protein
MCFTAESAEYAEGRLYNKPNLCDLCVLCGEKGFQVRQLLVTKYTPTQMITMPVMRVSERSSWNR